MIFYLKKLNKIYLSDSSIFLRLPFIGSIRVKIDYKKIFKIYLFRSLKLLYEYSNHFRNIINEPFIRSNPKKRIFYN